MPSADLGLTALALSGGGIRSAAFSLGVVQALAQRGILARTDYLSSVSGGGYLAAALSHLLNGRDAEHSAAPGDFPLRMGAGTAEPPALRHLQNSSNYLRSGGAFYAWAMPAVYVPSGPSAWPLMCTLVVLLGLVVGYPFLRRPSTPLHRREQLERAVRVALLGVAVLAIRTLRRRAHREPRGLRVASSSLLADHRGRRRGGRPIDPGEPGNGDPLRA